MTKPAPGGSLPPGGFVLVTGSRGKLDEVRRILGREVEAEALDLPEIQSVELEDVIAHKAQAAFAALRRPVLVEDTGLFVHAWNGLPGALVRWFVERVGTAGICRMLEGVEDRRATARTVLGLYDGRLRTFSGETAGRIADVPAGTLGFGWDPIFVPDGSTRTFAEMTAGEKDAFSMRRAALDALAAAGPGRPG